MWSSAPPEGSNQPSSTSSWRKVFIASPWDAHDTAQNECGSRTWPDPTGKPWNITFQTCFIFFRTSMSQCINVRVAWVLMWSWSVDAVPTAQAMQRGTIPMSLHGSYHEVQFGMNPSTLWPNHVSISNFDSLTSHKTVPAPDAERGQPRRLWWRGWPPSWERWSRPEGLHPGSLLRSFCELMDLLFLAFSWAIGRTKQHGGILGCHGM